MTSFPGASLDRLLATPPYEEPGEDDRDAPLSPSRMTYAQLYALVSALTPKGTSCAVEVRSSRMCIPNSRPKVVSTWTIWADRKVYVGPTPEAAWAKLCEAVRERRDLTGIGDRMDPSEDDGQ